METTEDQRRNLEVNSIDRTQPVQFHQGWRYVVQQPEIDGRSCRRIDGGLQTTKLVVRQAGQRRVAVVQSTEHQ